MRITSARQTRTCCAAWRFLGVTAGEYEARKMSKSCVSDEELAQGIVLACRAFPRGEVSLTVVGKMVKTVCAGAPCGSD